MWAWCLELERWHILPVPGNLSCCHFISLSEFPPRCNPGWVQNEQFTGAAGLATQELSQNSRWTSQGDVTWFSKIGLKPHWISHGERESVVKAGVSFPFWWQEAWKLPIGSSSQGICPWFGPLECSGLWVAPESLLGRFGLKLFFGGLTWNKL